MPLENRRNDKRWRLKYWSNLLLFSLSHCKSGNWRCDQYIVSQKTSFTTRNVSKCIVLQIYFILYRIQRVQRIVSFSHGYVCSLWRHAQSQRIERQWANAETWHNLQYSWTSKLWTSNDKTTNKNRSLWAGTMSIFVFVAGPRRYRLHRRFYFNLIFLLSKLQECSSILYFIFCSTLYLAAFSVCQSSCTIIASLPYYYYDGTNTNSLLSSRVLYFILFSFIFLVFH